MINQNGGGFMNMEHVQLDTYQKTLIIRSISLILMELKLKLENMALWDAIRLVES